MATNNLPTLLEQNKAELQVLLPKYLDVERFINNAKTIANNPALKNCSPESIMRAIMDAARRGWEVGGTSKHCAVVPLKLKSGGETAMLWPQWQGEAFSWMRSGAIKKLMADVVYEGDFFEMERGDSDRIVHRPDFTADRAPAWLNKLDNIVGAYAIAVIWSGEHAHAFVSRSQIRRLMETIKARNGDIGFGWRDWLPEMCRKTAVHRLNGIIQPPPDMTPEQIDAWNRASAATEFDVEISGQEIPPDNLPPAGGETYKPEDFITEKEMLDAERRGGRVSKPARTNGAPSVPDRTLNDFEQADLMKQAKGKGLKMADVATLLFDQFEGKQDLSELHVSEIPAFEAALG